MSISVNISAPKRMIDDIKKFYDSPKWMGDITKAIKKRVLKKTSEGKDYRSKNFKKYSDAYATKKGQRKVDLRKSDAMMNAVTAKVINPLTGVIFIKAAMGNDSKNRAVLAEYHNEGQGNNPVREFMNIPDSATKKLVKEFIDDPVQKIINKHR